MHDLPIPDDAPWLDCMDAFDPTNQLRQASAEVSGDKLVQLILYNPHISDFIYERKDGTYYSDRRNHGQSFVEVQKVDGKFVVPPPEFRD